jgi:hypothetical protein
MLMHVMRRDGEGAPQGVERCRKLWFEMDKWKAGRRQTAVDWLCQAKFENFREKLMTKVKIFPTAPIGTVLPYGAYSIILTFFLKTFKEENRAVDDEKID